MSAVVNCAAYAGGRRLRDVDVREIGDVLRQKGQFVWIGLHEPSAALLKDVQDAFGLHDLAIEDAHRAHQRPKLERYGDSLFVVLHTVQLRRPPGPPPEHSAGTARIDRAALEFGETHLFVGHNYVVSVRHGSSLSYADVRAKCESTPALLNKGPGFVLHALMDFIVDHYFPIVDALEDTLEQLEETIFREPLEREISKRLYELKRDLLLVKRGVSPLIEMCNRLMRSDLELITDDTRPYFRDVYDHAVKINEMVDSLRELSTSAFEANLALTAVGQNEAMRRLTAWAAIVAVPTMVGGIYGMNFEMMPELKWPFAYPVVLAGTFAVCGVLFYRFKRAGWL